MKKQKSFSFQKMQQQKIPYITALFESCLRFDANATKKQQMLLFMHKLKKPLI